MRRVLVDHARARAAAKRGGGEGHVEIVSDIAFSLPRTVDVIALDRALEELERLEPRSARTVEMRFFGGLSVEETAEALGTSPATVKRDWTMARAWLHGRLTDKCADPTGA
jgi:RNA polymerase sigma factor (TIGR02999 family)